MAKSRGFTLVEILIAVTVASITLVAAVGAANAQQRAFYNGQKIRAAQNSGRAALMLLEQKLPLAGFGMDAPLAFDFGWSDKPSVDRTNDSDELVFYARNPAYSVPDDPAAQPSGHAWRVTSFTGDSVTVDARPDDVFRQGQVLQAVCTGEPRYAYFTVSTTKKVGSGDVGNCTVLLEAVGNGSNPFRRQDVASGLTCATNGGVLFLIDRYRFYVRAVTVDGRTDPYLVLDTGVDEDGNGSVDLADELLVAEGIEAFQVSYVLTSGAIANGGSSGGANGGAIVATTFPGTVAAGQFAYTPSSFYQYSLIPPLPAARLTNDQGNIRTVSISLVARSPEPDPATPANLRWDDPTPNRLFRGNQTSIPGWVPNDGGYQRVVLETGVTLPNMTIRAMSYF